MLVSSQTFTTIAIDHRYYTL